MEGVDLLSKFKMCIAGDIMWLIFFSNLLTKCPWPSEYGNPAP